MWRWRAGLACLWIMKYESKRTAAVYKYGSLWACVTSHKTRPPWPRHVLISCALVTYLLQPKPYQSCNSSEIYMYACRHLLGQLQFCSTASNLAWVKEDFCEQCVTITMTILVGWLFSSSMRSLKLRGRTMHCPCVGGTTELNAMNSSCEMGLVLMTNILLVGSS